MKNEKLFLFLDIICLVYCFQLQFFGKKLRELTEEHGLLQLQMVVVWKFDVDG